MRRAVFLDRDGTLNWNDVKDGKPVGPTRLDDFCILPGVSEALECFHAAGLLNIVITNQPALAGESRAANMVREMHEYLVSELPIDDIFVCTHMERDGCDCRKPRPGLLRAAAVKWDIDLSHSVMVGDRWRDIDAGHAAGCLTVHIDHGYTGEKRAQGADLTVSSLSEAIDFVQDWMRRTV